MSQSPQRDESTTPIQPWEWIGAALGLLLLVFALVVLIQAHGNTEQAFSAPTVAFVSSHPHNEGGYPIEIEITNQANETLTEIEIVGTLELAGSEPEEATATITYLPAEATRRLFLVFQHPPTQDALTLRVQSYQLP